MTEIILGSEKIRVQFKGLTANSFQHPLDVQATENLKKLKGFDWLVSKFIEYGFERMEHINCTGGAVRVGAKQYPKQYAMLRECRTILDVAEPILYVKQGEVNAFTGGHNNPYIVLETGILELMDDDEIMAVIAHELGHIKCGHVLYETMARWIKPLFEIAGKATMGIGGLVGTGIEIALMAWQHRAELSADRASLLALQDIKPCISLFMKLAGGTERHADGLDSEQFLDQARSYRDGLDQKLTDRFYKLMAAIQQTHPFPVERAHILDEWAVSSQYEQIMKGSSTISGTLHDTKFCPTCGKPVSPNEKFCSKDGTPLVVQ